MKKLIVLILFFSAGFVFANDYRWDLVNALTRGDYPSTERIINQNINNINPQEKRHVLNLVVTYGRGDTVLRSLVLLQRHGVTPSGFDLFTAINRNQPNDVVQFLVNSGATANGEILLLAMERQRFDFARQFIQAGVDVNYQYPLSRNDSDGMTCLLHAARFNNFELVQLLTDRGANINTRNKEGSTALSIAQANNNSQIADYLIERGAVQTAGNMPRQQTGGGIGTLFENNTAEFMPANYRLSGTGGTTNDLMFTGNASAGRVGLIRDNRAYNGSYQAANGRLTILIEGRSFVYQIDSNTSFSGNGETWVRIGN
ncbi:MAG: ankyrin repeat domain-containing protein [Treponema sp.]|nr:ankyrin repeat domain-containing protein [Treponema sp.]MCL2236899.1 ankyrin repeat domain-containing protein [Treponema sp.]